MIRGKRDTIAAVATPAGAGGIGIVRVSGPDAIGLVAGLFGRSTADLPDRRLVHGELRDAAGERVDEVLVAAMRGPRSYTGEDVVEIHGHGGAVNMARLLRVVLDAGARHAEPGEFTRRAFENGRLDLVSAEAVIDVIEAGSERAWRMAQRQLAGGLGARIRSLRERATELLAEVEACIDFPEEGEEFLASAMVGQRASDLSKEINSLSSTYGLGRAVRSGIDVAIVGPVNAGKSSLFNALLDEDRALVDPDPGTTRDFVDARTTWEGIPVTLIDTAGEREADGVEQRGIERGQKRAAEADVRVICHPAPRPELPAGQRHREVHIVTKGDLLGGGSADILVTSASDGQGLTELRAAVIETALGGARESDEGFVVTSERQRSLLERAAAALRKGADAASAQRHTELVAVDIRDAAEHLAELLGERVGDEVLDTLFARFCIGK
jgi:tRNA modification GTPase